MQFADIYCKIKSTFLPGEPYIDSDSGSMVVSLEVTATTDNLAISAEQVATESQGVDESATTVSTSAATIEDFVRDFKI